MWSLLLAFGVRISVMFHLMFVHNTFNSVWVVGHLLGNSCPLGLQSVLIVLFLYVIYIYLVLRVGFGF